MFVRPVFILCLFFLFSSSHASGGQWSYLELNHAEYELELGDGNGDAIAVMYEFAPYLFATSGASRTSYAYLTDSRSFMFERDNNSKMLGLGSYYPVTSNMELFARAERRVVNSYWEWNRTAEGQCEDPDACLQQADGSVRSYDNTYTVGGKAYFAESLELMVYKSRYDSDSASIDSYGLSLTYHINASFGAGFNYYDRDDELTSKQLYLRWWF